MTYEQRKKDVEEETVEEGLSCNCSEEAAPYGEFSVGATYRVWVVTCSECNEFLAEFEE